MRGIDISAQFCNWIRYTEIRTGKKFYMSDLSAKTGIHHVSLSQYKTGCHKASNKTIGTIAAAFGISVETFIEGPRFDDILPETVEGLYDCRAERLKKMVCKGCQVPRRRCATQCLLDRFFRLWYEVVNGITDIREAEERAAVMAQESLDRANDYHDSHAGEIISIGHGGK